MWKFIYLLILVNQLRSIHVIGQVFGEKWKGKQSNTQETEEDVDFVKSNETKLEGIPKFIQEPDSLYYVYENKPAKIVCIAEPVSHVNIICNKEIYSYMDREVSESNLRVTKMNKNNQIDSTGQKWMFSLEISFNQVTEWFNTFICVCEAWNQVPVLRQAKKVHSRQGIFKEAYFKANFKKVPQSKTVVKGQNLMLTCVPPDSKPKAQIQWMKDKRKLYDNGRIKIVGEHQLLIEDTVLTDEGNYSCLANSLGETRYSPVAFVKIKEMTTESPLSQWSSWSACDDNCKKSRTRNCKEIENCKDVDKQIEKCTKTECDYNRAVGPYVKNENRVPTSSIQEARDIAMYVGLFVAVTILVMVITIIFCLIRRKALLPIRSQIRYPLHLNGNGVTYDAKSSLIKNPNVVTIKNQNSMDASLATLIQQRSYLSQSPPNLPPPTCLSEISSTNAYSTGVDFSYNSTGSGKFSQPLISNSSSASTTNKSKATSSSNTDHKIDPLTMSGTPLHSRPPSALYHELSLDRESLCNAPPFVSENIDLNTLAWGTISTSGGRLCLPQSGITLTIAPGSFVNSSSNEMFLAVSRNDPNPPTLSDTETLLTPIVLFGPANVPILKPCVLSIPHSADLRQGNWVIRLLSCVLPEPTEECKEPSVQPIWKNIATIGCENDTTPIYTHLDPFTAFIMLDQPQKICLVGQSYPGGKATKRLRLAAFGRPLSTCSYLPNYNIRIYVFSDTKEAFESVSSIEMKLGSTLLDITYQIIFSDSMGNLFFCIEELSTGWRSQLAAKYQEIPFQDIWSGSQSETLHCAFTFDNIDSSQQSLMCRITAYQSGFYSQKQIITIKQDKIDRNSTKRDLIQHEKVLLYSESNNTYLDPLMTVFRISNSTRKRLCFLLDNVTPRGNDWKQLCRQLSLNGYVNYFISKVSPTDAVLTLWESRNRNENALIDLIISLKAIGRIDCSTLLEADCSSSS